MTKTDELDWLKKRLDAVIFLLIERSLGADASSTERIEKLLKLGFGSPEIAQMTGETGNYVRNVASRMQRKPSKQRKAKS